MFIESEIEVIIKDLTLLKEEDHELKLWLQKKFKNMSCYRIEHFQRDATKNNTRSCKAVVALKITELTTDYQSFIQKNPHDKALLKSAIEQLFEGKETLRILGDPQITTE